MILALITTSESVSRRHGVNKIRTLIIKQQQLIWFQFKFYGAACDILFNYLGVFAVFSFVMSMSVKELVTRSGR